MDIKKIKETIDKIMAKYGIEKDRLCAENGNYIYYANGNDGTKFDYFVNERACEFSNEYCM